MYDSKCKVILIWTKWFERRHWDELPESMLPCAQYNINVSCRKTVERSFRIGPGQHPDEDYSVPTGESATAVLSNCRPDRLEYIDELQKYIKVDLYGSCGAHWCPGGQSCFSNQQKKYKFYLAFENSDYVMEKFYHNALQHNMLPVVINVRG